MPESFFNKVAGLRPAKKGDFDTAQMFSFELCEIFKNTFLESDCFSKYESSYKIAADHICLIKSCSENVWKISRNTTVSDCKF